MNILFLSALFPPDSRGGGEISTYYLAKALAKRGHTVQVVTSGRQEQTTEVEGVTVRRLPLPLAAKPLLEKRHAQRMARALSREIAWSEYDVVHAHDFKTAQIISELDLPRSLVTVRDYAQICGSPNNLLADGTTCPGCRSLMNVIRNRAVVEAPLVRKPFRIWQYRYNIGYRLLSFRALKHHVYISQAQLAEIRKQQDLTGITTRVIYNPVPPEYLQEKTGISVNETVLYVGTVQSYKGVGVLLRAFRAVAAQLPNVQLKIVGTGEQLTHYERLVARWGLQYRISFAGRVPHERLRRVYDEASVVVAPHVWVEPFGRTVVEAMARGKLVAAANIGGPAEMIQDRKTGFLFEHGSKESLAAVLRDVLDMGQLDRREVQRNARQWVEENLQPNRIAGQYEEVYKLVVGSE